MIDSKRRTAVRAHLALRPEIAEADTRRGHENEARDYRADSLGCRRWRWIEVF